MTFLTVPDAVSDGNGSAHLRISCFHRSRKRRGLTDVTALSGTGIDGNDDPTFEPERQSRRSVFDLDLA